MGNESLKASERTLAGGGDGVKWVRGGVGVQEVIKVKITGWREDWYQL